MDRISSRTCPILHNRGHGFGYKIRHEVPALKNSKRGWVLCYNGPRLPSGLPATYVREPGIELHYRFQSGFLLMCVMP